MTRAARLLDRRVSAKISSSLAPRKLRRTAVARRHEIKAPEPSKMSGVCRSASHRAMTRSSCGSMLESMPDYLVHGCVVATTPISVVAPGGVASVQVDVNLPVLDDPGHGSIGRWVSSWL